jgi:hypothetical protein
MLMSAAWWPVQLLRTIMYRRAILAFVLTSAYLISPTMAQQQPSAPPGAEPAPAPSPNTSNRRADCRQKLRQQGLRGAELRDQVQLCLADARKQCLKDAIDQKVTGAQRREFVKNCMGGRS